jgi:thiopeptide-type bacteriocin biosynthesis protein
MKNRSEHLVPAGFFAFRTPLLPFDTFTSWGANLEAPCAHGGAALTSALESDRKKLRARLDQMLARPEVAEAIFVASPSLAESIPVWREKPDGERGRKVERSLVKYLARMSNRATPLGLFAGISTGRIGKETALRTVAQSEYRRCTRPDFYYLGELAFKLFHNPEFCQDVPVRLNSSLHRTGNSLRFLALQEQAEQRSFHFIAADSSPAVDAALRLAASATITPRQLAAALAAESAGLSQQEAAEVVAQMIDVQLLVSDLDPPVTGPAALDELLRQLQEHPGGAELLQRFSAVRADLAEIDRRGVGGTPAERYREIAATLQGLPASVDLARLYQVDLFKPAAEATLGEAVVRELCRGITALGRLSAASDPLREFRELFRQRYEENPEDVPLLELLDPELGLYARGSAGNSEGTLLDEIELAEAAPASDVPFTKADQHRLRRLAEALAAGASEIVLTDEDIELLAVPAALPLPDSLAVQAVLAARSAQALREGEFRLHLGGAFGPSGGNLLGRFCYGDAALEEGVRRLLQAEEAQRPDAIYAEVVHLPSIERMGNFLQRPLLRGHEIPYLGRSGAPPAQQIAVSDLTVSVYGDRVVLRSRTLGKEVLPRLTNAHAYGSPANDRLYRFLCSLQQQGVAWNVGFRWGALDSAPFLPRVRYGNLVLSLATWNLQKDELAPLTKASDAALFQAVQALRGRLGLPRFVLFSGTSQSDNWLPVDLDNLLSIEALAQLVGTLQSGVLREMFPSPDQLVAEGPEGRFCHELVVPLITQRPPASSSVAANKGVCQATRTFSVGSEWLYAKVYLGSTPADDLLCALAPAFDRLRAAGAMNGYFFVRYLDPFWHLRIRVHGDPRRLREEVLPTLCEAAQRLIGEEVAWRFQLDTYRREIERYGGDAGIALCEQIFCADSAAVLGIIRGLTGEEPADIRWQLALPGMDRLLEDLGLGLHERLAALEPVASSFRREFKGSTNLERSLGKKHRALAKTVEELVGAGAAQTGPLAAARHFQTRSQSIRPLGEALRRHEARGELRTPLIEIAGSLLHMHVNRLLRAHQRQHELVLYDLLLRYYRSQKALAGRAAASS